MSKVYINRKGQGYTETVSDYTDRKEAKKDLTEYRLSDSFGYYYLSTRACKEWRDSHKTK